ncbi:MAG TPA: hypothetical protein VGB04_02745 [Allosphingosinicella sp.]|jgi:hypothetical protein
MRLTMLAAALFFAVPAAAAPTQAPTAAPEEFATPSSPWSFQGERLLLVPAKISAPRRLGTAEHFEATEFSHKGEGVDAVLKYRTPDRDILATLYVYYPSIAHTGIQAIATDQAIRSNGTPPAEPAGTATTGAGGIAGAAQTADYNGYLGKHFSKAAFIKAGRWMVKVRVTGPEARAGEVNEITSALLNGLRFEGDDRPRPATPLAPNDCGIPAGREARLLPDDTSAFEGALLGAFDATGQTADNAPSDDQKVLLPRIGSHWCRSALTVRDSKLTILRATDADSPSGDLDGRSILLLLYSDAGGLFEVVRLKGGKYLLLDHKIAEMRVLGTYDSVPSEDQLRRLFIAPGEQGRVRAQVRLKANGNSDIQIIVPENEEKRRPAKRRVASADGLQVAGRQALHVTSKRGTSARASTTAMVRSGPSGSPARTYRTR